MYMLVVKMHLLVLKLQEAIERVKPPHLLKGFTPSIASGTFKTYEWILTTTILHSNTAKLTLNKIAYTYFILFANKQDRLVYISWKYSELNLELVVNSNI